MSDGLTGNQRVLAALYAAAVVCRARRGPPRDPGALIREALEEAIADKIEQMRLFPPGTQAHEGAAMQLARWEEARRLNR